MPKDNETLKSLEVKTTGTVIFLYLLSAKDAGFKRECLLIGEDRRLRDKTPSLPPRDYKTDENNGVPALNARSHRYATVPSNPQRASDFRYQPDRPPLLPGETTAVTEEQYLIANGKALVPDRLPPSSTIMDTCDVDRTQFYPRQILTQQNEGWFVVEIIILQETDYFS